MRTSSKPIVRSVAATVFASFLGFFSSETAWYFELPMTRATRRSAWAAVATPSNSVAAITADAAMQRTRMCTPQPDAADLRPI